MDNRAKTIFCDIDGTLIKHSSPVYNAAGGEAIVLDGTLDKLIEWDKKGYKIILTTGRKESLRAATEKQLAEAGIFYDQLIMGIGGGPRILINDKKPEGTDTVFAINLERDKGIKDIDL